MILFCAHDAGPANYLAVLIRNLGGEYAVLASEVAAPVFERHGIPARVVPRPYSVESIGRVVDVLSPRLTVAGTSWGNALEKYVLAHSLKKPHEAVAVIDTWAFYKERFLLEDRLLVPPHVIVNDELAREGAIEDGLPAEVLRPLGNAYLDHISRNGSAVPANGWREALGLQGKTVVTFISESYREDFPPSSGFHQGFDEFQVVEDLIAACRKDRHLLIKLHPAEPAGKYDAYKGPDVTVISKADPQALIAGSDFVVGMGSTLLLEAALFRNDVVSYRPGERKPFMGNRIGATALVQDAGALRGVLEGAVRVKNRGLKGRFEGSIERITAFIQGRLN